MSDRFDLEQKIMGCWNIVEDLKLLANFSTDTKVASMLQGLADLYQLKFEDTFECFEKSIQSNTTTVSAPFSWAKMDFNVEDFQAKQVKEKPRKKK